MKDIKTTETKKMEIIGNEVNNREVLGQEK